MTHDEVFDESPEWPASGRTEINQVDLCQVVVTVSWLCGHCTVLSHNLSSSEPLSSACPRSFHCFIVFPTDQRTEDTHALWPVISLRPGRSSIIQLVIDGRGAGPCSASSATALATQTAPGLSTQWPVAESTRHTGWEGDEKIQITDQVVPGHAAADHSDRPDKDNAEPRSD